MTRTLIRNATVVLPEATAQVDVLLADGKIAAIDPPQGLRSRQADETVDASGLHLIPGAIDDQVHFRDPGPTHKEDLHTGSLACAKGGITTFLEMPNTQHNTITVDALHQKLELAAGKAVVNYGFYIGATPDNLHHLQQAERNRPQACRQWKIPWL